jgi:phage tail-like protein
MKMTRAEIASLLPAIFRRTIREQSLLESLIDVMAELHAPSENVLERLDTFFDPFQAPDAFVPYLSGWVDLQRLFDEVPASAGPDAGSPLGTGPDRLRALTAAAVFLSHWRGTEKGLRLFLSVATGIDSQAFSIHGLGEADTPQRAFHIRVVAPESARVHNRLIERIIDEERPAFVTWELSFQ